MDPNSTIEHRDSLTGETFTTRTGRRPDGEDWSLVDAIEQDSTPLAILHREEICAAVRAAAEKHHGVVSAGTIRDFLPAGVNPHLIGNVLRSLRKRKVIQWTGRYVPSGNAKSRNNLKPVHEWYVPSVEAVA